MLPRQKLQFTRLLVTSTGGPPALDLVVVVLDEILPVLINKLTSKLSKRSS
jgi:hypothetical protein